MLMLNVNALLTIVMVLLLRSPVTENNLAVPCTYVIESSSPPMCCVGAGHQITAFQLP